MCLAIPGKIVSISGEKAIADFSGARKAINISLVKVKKGDFVMVHTGFAIGKLNKQDAKKTTQLFAGKHKK